jgi:hypothetical protein
MNLITQGWVLVMIGAMSIAVGGTLTTLGWKKLDSYSRQKAVISGVAREWEINDTLLHKDALFISTDATVLGSHLLYPRFKSSALDVAVSSGLFRPSQAMERQALRVFADYETTIADINARLNVSDSFALSTQDQTAIAAHRAKVKSSAGLAGFSKEHAKLKEFLERNYGWSLKERFLDQ